MKTLAQAIAIAEALNGGPVDRCVEREDAWVLIDSSAPMTILGREKRCITKNCWKNSKMR